MKILLTCFLLVTGLSATDTNTNDRVVGLLNKMKHNAPQTMRKVSGSWSNSKYINKHEVRHEIDWRGGFKGYIPNKLKNSDGMLIGSKGQYWIFENTKTTCSAWKDIVEANGIKLNKHFPNVCKGENKTEITAIVLQTAIGERTLSKGFWYLAKFDLKKKNILTLTDFQGTRDWYIPTESPEDVKNKREFSDAVYSKNIEKMKQILHGDTQIDVNEMYLLAMELGDLETVKLLLDNGADLNYKTSFDNPASKASCNSSNIDKLDYILSLGYKYESLGDRSPIYYATLCKEQKVIDYWIEKGIDINLERTDGRTPLFDVAQNRKNMYESPSYDNTLKVLKNMISKGANPLHIDKKQATILHYISGSGNVNQIKFVKTYFKDINIQDDFLQTPLHYVVREIQYDQRELKYEVIKYLVNAGANKNIKDKLGRTPYDMVKKMSFPEERVLVLLKP